MIMADVLKIALIIIGFLLCYVVYWLASAALFPAVVERAKQQYDTRPVRATLAGLGLALPFIALSIGIGQVAHPVAKMLGVALIGIPVLYGLLGSAGLALRIGTGMKSSIDDAHPWRRMLRGSVVLSLTFLLPVIGWFIIMPWAIISGLGASVISMFQKQPALQSAADALPQPLASSAATVAAKE
jgi:hypothetical protein